MTPLFYFFFAGLALARAAVLKNGAVIPVYAQPCGRSSPDFNACMKEALQTLIPKISKDGIKAVQLGSLDPVFVPELQTTFSGAGYSFKSVVRNSNTHGMSKVKILDFRSDFKDPENINIEVDFYIPKILIEGSYKTNGLVADFPVNGKGVYNISMTDIQGTMKCSGQIVSDDGEDYLRIQKVGMRPDVGNMNVYFSNLVSGNPELSSIAVTFFNQFWRIIYPELLPYAEKGFDKVLRNMINQATLKIPFNQLFPETV